MLDPEYRRAHEAIIRALGEANARDPDAHHVHDVGPELGWQLAAADVAVTDISAMVYDRLATGRPLVVTRPVAVEADVDESGYLGDAEWLTADGAGDIVALVDRVVDDPEARGRLEHWVRRHFGDTSPGAATHRFESAVARLVQLRDDYAARRPSTDDPRSTGSAGDADQEAGDAEASDL